VVAVCDDPRHQGVCELPCEACDAECHPIHRRAVGDAFYTS
jgi:hypothetical protein